MLIDGLTLASLIKELGGRIKEQRIQKIYQPEADEIVFLLSDRTRLLLSASGEKCRIGITEHQKENPDKAPNFCMLLRKYLQGGRISAIRQESLERIAYLDIDARDELGNVSPYELILELMGHSSNMILVNKDGTVIDSLRRVPPDRSSVRQLLPGVRYMLPPLGKTDIRNGITEELIEAFKADCESGMTQDRALVNRISGMAPAYAREAVRISNGSPDSVISSALLLINRALEDPSPCIDLDDKGKPVFFSVFPLPERQLSERKMFGSVNACVDDYYHSVDMKRALEKERSSQMQVIRKNIQNIEKRLSGQLKILASAKDTEKLRIYGELLTANLYRIKRGASSAEVYYYYTDETVTVPLDPRYPPSVNAQRYYKKYGKTKTAESLARDMAGKLKSELDYLEALMYDLESAETTEEALDIRDELIRQGYIKTDKRSKVKLKDPLSSPMRYRASDGSLILAGRNSRQNDALTLRAASDSDIWFHSKNIQGSHVILFTDGKAPSETALFEAATVAACHSKGAMSGKVDIDYTEVRNVWKPQGAKPGMVLFKNNRTLSVRPDADLIKKLET